MKKIVIERLKPNLIMIQLTDCKNHKKEMNCEHCTKFLTTKELKEFYKKIGKFLKDNSQR